MKHLIFQNAMTGVLALSLLACQKNVKEDALSPNARIASNEQLPPAQTEWTLTERPTGQAEASRLIFSLRTADFDPVGLRATANQPLLVNVTQISGTNLPQLIVGSYDRETVTTYNLQLGTNTINNTNGGDLYLRYASATPNTANRVKVTFQSGFKTIPFYVQGTTTHQQWIDMLSADTSSPNAILVSQRAFITVSQAKAEQYQSENQDTILAYIDRSLKAEGDISGLDNSSPVHAPLDNKLMIVERNSGYMDATHEGRVRIVGTSFNRVLVPAQISGNGWGLWHEMGHHHQMWNWTFGAVGEVNPNIYTLAAKRIFQPGAKGLSASDWTGIKNFLARPDSTRDYTASNVALYVRLGIYQQLWMAFGDTFFHNLHKLVREERPQPVGNAEEEMRVLMLYACRASGKDLGQFFKDWGFKVNTSIYNEITALQLPAPAVNPSSLSEY
ncbi:M60 family metallopeptidase [Chitinophaga pendula]|uniref:M60 family metallopeptidase n=1 Tax=Chitinophaga TaxID=79328 RepID=UPI000BAEE367|nr:MULTISPECIES: M60 family metallopeptidase [Chitinophaga]ASZ12240.1 hypothetical protein CK934_15360 [Chitinophaga sp. MD30]UCJ04728.1 M60 family metallopeptidase [Chitinophaga pendula]